MGYPPSGRGWTITSPSGPGPGKLFPARPHAGREEDSHVPAGPRPGRDPPRVPTRAAGSQGVTRPQLDAAGSRPERLRGPRGPGGKRPPSRRGRRDRRGHGARCKAVPARGAGCGPRAEHVQADVAVGRASPHHAGGAVTVEVTAHGVKRSRPAGPGAACGSTRRGGPACRAGRIMPNREALPSAGISAGSGWGRGAAAEQAAGLKNDQQRDQRQQAMLHC